MINIHYQNFYERTGTKHEIAINFGWVNPASNGHYEVLVDNTTHSKHRFKGDAFDAVVEIIRENNWKPIRRMDQ